MTTVAGFEPTEVVDYDHLFIDGAWIESRSERHLSSIDPSTEQVWSRVPDGDAEDVGAAVTAARGALDGPWHDTITPTERGGMLLALAELLRRDAEIIARIESRDNGKPLRDSLSEMDRAANWLTFFAGAADKIRGAQIPIRASAHAFTRREPVGVVGAILPWNSPLLLTCWKLGPALAAGNTIVIKPSELTSASALELGRLVEEVGFPAGVVNVVPGRGEEAGAALVAHPDVNKISFTGEHSTAQRIMAAGAASLKRCSFECGGKSPFLIFADADLDRALPGAVHSAFRSTGQSCSLTSRLFVERPIYEEVVEAIAERASRIRVGMPFDEETHIGPQTSAQQLDKTHSFIAEGRDAGYRMVHGGGRPAGLDKGYFVEPTVFADVENTSRLAQQEIFGPVLTIMPFDDEATALAMANDSRYGLVAGVWTQNVSRAHRVAARLQAGLVSVNTFRAIHWSLPYGGFKLSGLGRENGLEALDEYTETKSVVIDVSEGPAPDPFG